MHAKLLQSCPTLSDPMNCSPPGYSLIPFSRGSSWPRNRIWVSCIVGRFFIIWATRETWWINYTSIFLKNKEAPEKKNKNLLRKKAPCTPTHAKTHEQMCPRGVRRPSRCFQGITWWVDFISPQRTTTGGPDQHCASESLQDRNSEANSGSAVTTCHRHS